MPLFGRLGYILQAQPYRVEPLHLGSDFLGFISPHNAVVFHRLPAEPVGSGERGRPAPPGGRCVWGSRGQEGALRGLRGRVGSAGALPGAGGASPPRVLQEPRGARAAALGVREAGRGAAAGVYRERGEAASAGAEPGREGRRREEEKGGSEGERRRLPLPPCERGRLGAVRG